MTHWASNKLISLTPLAFGGITHRLVIQRKALWGLLSWEEVVLVTRVYTVHETPVFIFYHDYGEEVRAQCLLEDLNAIMQQAEQERTSEYA